MNDIKKYAVIVAGGKGTRMGTSVPKQFLPFLGKPLLCHAIEAFAQAVPGIHLILVLPKEQLDSAQTVLRSYLSTIRVTTVAGGDTRYHSVQNGLKMVNNDGIVFIHDGVRPLISSQLINSCFLEALEKGSAVPFIPASESMRIVEGEASKPLDREKLVIIQTPQTFKTDIIIPAFRQEYQPMFTDEATVVEASGARVHLIEGMRDNIKITTPEDMIIAEVLLKARMGYLA
jgi:2-C-methyl-D-erythritol 4-phosphate cytidylyltransferase